MIDMTPNREISILEQSEVYFDENSTYSIEDIISNNTFLKIYKNSYINIGVEPTTIWVKFKVKNYSNRVVKKIVVITSTLVEEIELYSAESLENSRFRGTNHITQEHTTIFPYYPIELKADESREYYLRINNQWTTVGFSVLIKDEKIYREEDKKDQLIKMMFLAMIIILIFYSLIIGFYMQDKSYIYYAFYLLALSYQQSLYLGLGQIYFPLEYITSIKSQKPIAEVAIVLITASFYSISFLKTATLPMVHMIYKWFIIIAFMEIVIFNFSQFYSFDIMILTSLVFIIFNLIAGIISYLNGNRQARLFILGFGLVFFSYAVMMSDALGFSSLMLYFPYALIFGTTIEALILSVAFADRYSILQMQKDEEDKNKKAIIKAEVIEKTAQLKQLVYTKELLLREVHHRVKNNLQIILSLIRLQNDAQQSRVVSDKLISIENRINAIAKTYNMLIFDDNLNEIDMEEYIESLLIDIEESMCEVNCKIETVTEIDALLPLSKSVYIGIIINELVTNSYKYAFDKDEGVIWVTLEKIAEEYVLKIGDSGKGFEYNKSSNSLGLKLIHALVKDQLKGEIEMIKNETIKYIIRFRL
ncbi:MAG: hypothetical protein KAG56_05935 [Sulfurovaceae bacterium]|nr:hypothetical protein [Sulfurovaceae bacterium]